MGCNSLLIFSSRLLNGVWNSQAILLIVTTNPGSSKTLQDTRLAHRSRDRAFKHLVKMGIGKYLHRKKGDTPSPQQPSRQSRVVSQGNTDSALGISRYEATAPGSKPETGSYPIRGNNSTAAVNSRRGSIRNSMDTRSNQPTRPDTAPSHPVGSTAPRLETPPNNNYADYHFFDQPPTNTQTRTQTTTTTTTFAGRQQQRQMEADSGLARDFSGLNLGSNSGKLASSSYIIQTLILS